MDNPVPIRHSVRDVGSGNNQPATASVASQNQTRMLVGLAGDTLSMVNWRYGGATYSLASAHPVSLRHQWPCCA